MCKTHQFYAPLPILVGQSKYTAANSCSAPHATSDWRGFVVQLCSDRSYLPLPTAVGILAAHCAQYRKARRVILIDEVDYRLKHAQKVCPGVEVVNFKEKATLQALK